MLKMIPAIIAIFCAISAQAGILKPAQEPFIDPTTHDISIGDCVEAPLDYWSSYLTFYRRPGFRMDANFEGNRNDQRPPLITAYDSSLSSCAAMRHCADDASMHEPPYWTVDLHYLKSRQVWECVQYSAPTSDPEVFSVQDDDVLTAQGLVLDMLQVVVG